MLMKSKMTTKMDADEITIEMTNPIRNGTSDEDGGRGRMEPKLEEGEPYVVLNEILKSRSEFHGIAALGKFALITAVAIAIPTLILQPGSTSLRSSVVEAVRSYTDSGEVDNAFSDVSNPQESMAYATGLLYSIIDNSDSYGYRNDEIRIGANLIKVLEIQFCYVHKQSWLGSQTSLAELNNMTTLKRSIGAPRCANFLPDYRGAFFPRSMQARVCILSVYDNPPK